MKGKILDFSIADSQGVISGDDGNRYNFNGKEWKSRTSPQAGNRVDYDIDGFTATSVYLDQGVTTSNNQSGNLDNLGFYKSSDDAVVAGVCAGLAHKWGLSRGGLRAATFLAHLFTGITLIIYILCWIVFPAKPTKNVD